MPPFPVLQALGSPLSSPHFNLQALSAPSVSGTFLPGLPCSGLGTSGLALVGSPLPQPVCESRPPLLLAMEVRILISRKNMKRMILAIAVYQALTGGVGRCGWVVVPLSAIFLGWVGVGEVLTSE